MNDTKEEKQKVKKAILVWLCVAGLVMMGCSPAIDNVDSFGSLGALGDSSIEIWNWYDLDAIRDSLDGSYILMTDLDSGTAGYEELAGPGADNGQGWEPIGKHPGPLVFTGTLDGQGYEIRGLHIHRPGESSVGVFGFAGEGSIIKNVGVVDVLVTGDALVGSLVGRSYGSVSGSYSTGNISGGGAVGGLVGCGTVVSDSHSTADVSGEWYVGGLVGQGSCVVNSYARGRVTGDGGSVGGLIGLSAGDVTHSHATGRVTSAGSHVGGLVGSSSGGISNSYANGSVTGQYRVGGLVGGSSGIVSDSYADGNVNGDGDIGGLVGSGGTVSNSYYNYDAVLINGENVVTIGALFNEDFGEWLANDKSLDVNERLSEEDGYYLIDSLRDFRQLLAFGQNASLRFRLTSDLDLTDEPDFYIPYLAGEFHGNGHRISNLSLGLDFVGRVGLFGFLASGGRITEAAAESVSISGYRNVGGLVGTNRGGGVVSKSYSTGSVTGKERVGGLVGFNDGSVSDSYSASDVSGTLFVGGLVGANWDHGTVSNSYSTGDVTGESWVGGLVGFAHGTVSNSFWNVETSGMNVSDGGTGKTTSEMKDIATFLDAGWDIGTTTLGDLAGGYPFLGWELGDSTVWLIYERISPVPYQLTISSAAGGSVVIPGEGTYNYDPGTIVGLVASPDAGGRFVNWTGDVGTIADVNAASTTITMNGNYSIAANFTDADSAPSQWEIELGEDNIILVEAQPDLGFHWSYYLFVPANTVNDPGNHMLVEPNNTGTRSDDMDIHYERAMQLVQPGRHPRSIAEGLNTPLLVPVFPRPATNPAGAEYHVYPHALDRDTLLITEETLRRVDLQLLAMIDHAQSILRANAIQVADKVFMHGFSASGNYLTRFSLIHPERVKAVAAGGLNGMPTLPVGSWDEWDHLRYPTGIADLDELTGKHFDVEAFKGVAQYWYMGYLDKNDTLPYSECYAPQDASLLREMLGDEILDRWEKSQEIFEYAGVPAQFFTYYATAHTIRTEMIQDIIRFFQANEGDEIVHIEPHQYPYVPYQELTEVTVIGGAWYESSEYPEGMKQYYSSNTFAVFTKEWIEWQDYQQLATFVRENLPEEGRVIYLVAPDSTKIESRATGATFSSIRGGVPERIGFIFQVDVADMSRVQPGVPYQLEPIKACDIYFFTVQDGVTLTSGYPVSVETQTGTGTAYFTTSHGVIEDLESLFVPANPPDGYTFPHGLFSFKITDLDYDGQTVMLTIELPSTVLAGTRWWKYHDGQWHDYNIPITISGNTITITLTDGGVGDIDDVAGQITDPGGPGYPLSLGYTVGWETQPINKVAVYAPWIALLAAIAGASLLVLRRRQTQN